MGDTIWSEQEKKKIKIKLKVMPSLGEGHISKLLKVYLPFYAVQMSSENFYISVVRHGAGFSCLRMRSGLGHAIENLLYFSSLKFT